MKRLLIFLLISSSSVCIFGQETFHKLIYLEFPATRFSSVLPTDSCFYVTGTFTDSISPVRTGVLFGKLDLSGDLWTLNTVKDPDMLFFNDYCDLGVNPDSQIFYVGAVNDEPGSVNAIIYLYGVNGDTILTKKYNSILYPLFDFMLPQASLSKVNGDYAVLSEHDAGSSPQNIDLSLLVIDYSLEIKSYKRYGILTQHELAHSLIAEFSGGYIIGAERTNEGLTFINYENRTLLIKTDSLGNQQWQWLSPEGVLQDGAHAMIKTPDGGLVVASGQGIEWGTNPNYHYLFWDALIFKLDADRNVVWSTPFRGYHPSPQTTLTEMVEAQGGSGFVASGIVAEKEGDEPAYHTSWLVKVSPEGDSLWARRYTYFDGEFVAPEVWDMKATPDGGYVLVGTAPQVFDINTNPYIPAWIMKVDSFGCLIPGCQLDDTTAVSGSPEQTARLAIFPNPASDFLHFELRPAGITSTYTARIVDTNGKTMTEIPAVSTHTTYTLPVWHWPPGVYFLQLLHEGLPVRTERFVVRR